MKIPNILTLLRIILIPVFVVVYYLPVEDARLIAAGLFGLAAITDWFDGYLARKLQQTSPFGAFLDPVADKLIVAAALVVLVDTYSRELHSWPVLTAAPAIVIIGREIVISALREWMAEMGARAQVAVSNIGKIKTTLQMVAILVLIAAVPGTLAAWIGIAALYAATVLTLWSMIVYLVAAWPHLREDI